MQNAEILAVLFFFLGMGMIWTSYKSYKKGYFSLSGSNSYLHSKGSKGRQAKKDSIYYSLIGLVFMLPGTALAIKLLLG